MHCTAGAHIEHWHAMVVFDYFRLNSMPVAEYTLGFVVHQRRGASSQVPCLMHVLRLTITFVSPMIKEREHIRARDGHDNPSSQILDWRDQCLRSKFGNVAPIYTVYSLDVSKKRVHLKVFHESSRLSVRSSAPSLGFSMSISLPRRQDPVICPPPPAFSSPLLMPMFVS